MRGGHKNAGGGGSGGRRGRERRKRKGDREERGDRVKEEGDNEGRVFLMNRLPISPSSPSTLPLGDYFNGSLHSSLRLTSSKYCDQAPHPPFPLF